MRGLRLGVAISLVLALAACGAGGNPTGAEPAAAPNPNLLRRGNAAEPGTLDPDMASGNWEINIIDDLLMGLTTDGPDGNPVPGMAKSWDVSADGLTWTFRLRDENWSDGVPVTAGDFVYAWRRILDPQYAAGYAYYLYLIKNAEAVNTGKLPASALGVVATDDHTLVVHLEHPAPYLIEYLTHVTAMPVPEHVVAKLGSAWTKPGNYVSNGAYVLKEWVPNDHITLAKNPTFYDAANVKIPTVIYYPTTDYQAALRRMRAGELDVQDRMPAPQIDWIRANMPNTLRLNPVLTVEYMVGNFAHKPFGDIRVREAMNLAIDRETITDKLHKVGEPPAYSIVPPTTANFPDGNAFSFKDTSYAERLKRAQMLMMQAGYGPDHQLYTTLSIRSASTDSLRTPIAIQGMLKSIYIDARILQSDAAVAYTKWQQGDFDLAIPAWGADFNDASTFLELLRTGNQNNYEHYSNLKFDALLDAANAETDLAKRGAILKQAEAVALTDYAWVPLYFWVSGALVQPYVKGWAASARDTHPSRYLSIDPSIPAETGGG